MGTGAGKELNFDFAVSLARRLKTIPGDSAYFSDDAVLGIAADLVRWCKGAWLEGVAWSPEQQADWLVTQARETWEKWEGTAAFKRLFLEKFDPQPPRRPPIFEGYPKQAILCAMCGDQGTVRDSWGVAIYCNCEYALSMQADPKLGDRWIALLNSHSLGNPQRKGPGSQIAASEAEFREHQRRVAKEIADAEAVLADENETRERKEIARETIKTYRPDTKKKKAAKGRLPWQI